MAEKNSIELAFKILDIDVSTIKKLTTELKEVETAVNSAVKKIGEINSAVSKITVPKNLKTLTEELAKIDKIKAPNLNNIAEGFKKLNGIKNSIPNLDPFAVQLKKLNGITLPNLLNISNGLEKIIALPLSGLAMKVGTVDTQLRRLKGIDLPNLSKITTGLTKLMATPLSGFAMKIGTLDTQLRRLDGITLPNLAQIGIGLAKLMATPLSGFNAKITSLEIGLQRLAKINLDSLSSTLQNLNKLNLGKVGLELKKIEKATQDVGKTAEKSGKRVRSFSESVQTVMQFRVISGILMGIHNAFDSGIKSIVEYDQALKDLQAITGSTGLEVAQMGYKILEVASATKFSASEVAEGMRIIAQAGFTSSEAVQTMQSVSDLATGTLSTMAESVDLVTTALRVFNIDASNSQMVVDVFANAVNKSKLTIDKFRTAMNYVGPIAKDAGISFQELSASMGTLANSGLRASTIGTGLRNVFAQLISPSKKLKEAAAEVGVTLSEIDPRVNSFKNVLSNLGLILQDSSTAFEVFGKRGASAALALSTSGSQYNDLLSNLNASGSAAKMAATQMEGLAVSFKNLKDRVGVLAVALGEAGISKVLRVSIDLVKGLVNSLTILASNGFGQLIITLGGTIAALYAFATVIGVVAIASGSAMLAPLIASFSAMSVAIGGAIVMTQLWIASLGPVGIALLAIGAAMIFLKGASSIAAKEASLMSDEYGNLTKKVKDHQVAISSLKEGSVELKTENLKLRTSLLAVGSKYGVLSKEARAAANSINPLTGVIDKNSDALKIYNKLLNDLQFAKLKEAGENLNKDLEKQATWIRRNLNRLWADIKGLGKDDPYAQTTLDTMAFVKTLQEGQVSVRKLGEEIESWDSTSLNEQQEITKNNYVLLVEQSRKFYDLLLSTGKITLNQSAESVEKVGLKLGYTGKVLEGVVMLFEDAKKASEGSFTNLLEKLGKEGEGSIDHLQSQIEAYIALEGAIDAKDKKAVNASLSELKLLVDVSEALKKKVKEDTASENLSAIERQAIWENYHAKKAILDSKATEERVKLSKISSFEIARLLDHETTQHQKAIKENEAQFTDSLTGEITDYNAFTKKKIKLDTDYKTKKALLLEGKSTDYTVIANEYKDSLNKNKTEYKKFLFDLEKARFKNMLNEEEYITKKIEIDKRYYKNKYALAKENFARMSSLDKNTTEYVKAKQELEKHTQEMFALNATYLLKHYENSAKIKEKITDLQKKSYDETVTNEKNLESLKKDYADKKLDIETKLTEKIKDINEKLTEKLEGLDEKVLQSKKDLAASLIEIEATGADKIRAIKQRGMTDYQKDKDNEEAANEKLSEGVKLLAEAEKTKDVAALQRGIELIKQSGTIGSGLENERKAINAVNKETEALKKAADLTDRIKQLDIEKEKIEATAKAEKEKSEAISEYNEKLSSAENYFNKVSTKEDARHAKIMSNINAEMAKIKEKLALELASIKEIETSQNNNKSNKNENQEIKDTTKSLKEKNKVIDDGQKSYESWTEKNEKYLDSVTTSGIWEENTKGVRSFTDAATASADETGKSFEMMQTKASINDKIFQDNLSAFNSLKDKIVEVTGILDNGMTFNSMDTEVSEFAKSFQGIGDIANKVKPQIKDALSQKDIDDSIKEYAKSLGIVEEKANEISKVKITPEVDKDEKVSAFKTLLGTIKDVFVKIIVDIPNISLFNSFMNKWDSIIDGSTKHLYVVTHHSSTHDGEGYATGGSIPGYGGGDTVKALLEPGEWVIRKEAVKKFGSAFMSKINSGFLSHIPKFATGGQVFGSDTPKFATGGLVPFSTGGQAFNAVSNSVGDVKSRLDQIEKITKQYSRKFWKASEDDMDVLVDTYNNYTTQINDIEKDRLKSIENLNEDHTDSIVDIEKDRLKSIENINEDYADSIVDAQEDLQERIADVNEDYNKAIQDEKENLAESLIALEEGRVDAIEKIEEDLLKTQQDIANDRLQIEENMQKSILSANENTADKLRTLRQRDLSESEIAEEDKKKASFDMRNAVAQLNAAKGTGDVEAIDEAMAKLGELQNYYADLEDTDLAVKGVSSIGKYITQGSEIKAGAENVLKDKESADVVDAADMAKDNVNIDNNEQIVDAKDASKKRLEDMAEAHSETLADLEEEHAEKLADMAEAQVEALADLEEEHAEKLADMEEIREKTLSDLEEEHAEKLDAIYREHSKALENLDEEAKEAKKISKTQQKKDINSGLDEQGLVTKADLGWKFNTGGFVSQGAGGIDDVPALLTRGEFVQKRSAVEKYGVGIMQKINQGLIPTSTFQNIKGFNTGGFVSALKNMSGIAKFSEGGEVSSATVNHSIDFNLGNKSFGPFQGSPVTINSFISELSKAKGRA